MNKYIIKLLTIIPTLFLCSSLSGENCGCCCQAENDNHFYVGAFGGQAFSNSTKFVQMGTAFFTEAQGGPLAVMGRGSSKKTNPGFGGVQIGYEWKNNGCCNSVWSLNPAAEIEALFYSQSHKASLGNNTDRLPEHLFDNTFPSKVGVYLVNGLLSLSNSCFGSFTPYIGAGVGAANICIHKAKSIQVSPPELEFNHFNSDRSDKAWTFAAQAKAGVKFNFCEKFHIFAEYRFLYVDMTKFVFGSTVYPTHVPTSPWNVKMENTCYNAYVVGIQFDI